MQKASLLSARRMWSRENSSAVKEYGALFDSAAKAVYAVYERIARPVIGFFEKQREKTQATGNYQAGKKKKDASQIANALWTGHISDKRFLQDAKELLWRNENPATFKAMLEAASMHVEHGKPFPLTAEVVATAFKSEGGHGIREKLLVMVQKDLMPEDCKQAIDFAASKIAREDYDTGKKNFDKKMIASALESGYISKEQFLKDAKALLKQHDHEASQGTAAFNAFPAMLGAAKAMADRSGQEGKDAHFVDAELIGQALNKKDDSVRGTILSMKEVLPADCKEKMESIEMNTLSSDDAIETFRSLIKDLPPITKEQKKGMEPQKDPNAGNSR
jgi:hypothetical protein